MSKFAVSEGSCDKTRAIVALARKIDDLFVEAGETDIALAALALVLKSQFAEETAPFILALMCAAEKTVYTKREMTPEEIRIEKARVMGRNLQ
jgi:hypothetical protein